MAIYTTLSEDELARVMRCYGLPPPERVLPEPKGSVNTNYHLWAGGRRWFLRLNEGKSPEDVAFEAEVLRFLSREGFPAVPLVPTSGGDAQMEVAGRPAMLFAFVAGAELARSEVTPERCRAIGALLGRLHALAPRVPVSRPNPYGWERVAGWVRELEPSGGGDPLVAPALPLLRSELAASRNLPQAPRGLVHGDLFTDNVLWKGQEVAAVLDWEMCCVDALAYDLAVMLNAWCYDHRFRPELARALFEGYRRRAEVDEATRAALYPYTRYVALRYTASRIHAFHLAALPADRLSPKDWRRYRDRLAALVELPERELLSMCGL